MFNDMPYDIIYLIGKMLDYDSTIQFNRVLLPADRVVHRVFTKDEAKAHELEALGQSCTLVTRKVLDMTISKCNRVFYFLHSMVMFRKYNRQHILISCNERLKQAIIHKQ